MPVSVTLDAVLNARRITAKELARRIGLSETQMSLLRTGKVKGVRFSTVAALCAVLECRPGDLLSYTFDADDVQRERLGTPGDGEVEVG